MYVTLFTDAQSKFEKSQISLSKSLWSIQTESPIKGRIEFPNVGDKTSTLSVFVCCQFLLNILIRKFRIVSTKMVTRDQLC